MRAYLKLLSLFAVTTIAAYLASRVFMPLADSEQPQPYLQLALLLRSIELTGLGSMVLVLAAGVATRLSGPSG